MSLIKQNFAKAQKTAMAGGNFAKKVVSAPFNAGKKVGIAARKAVGTGLDRMAKSGGSLGGPNALKMQQDLQKRQREQAAKNWINSQKKR